MYFAGFWNSCVLPVASNDMLEKLWAGLFNYLKYCHHALAKPANFYSNMGILFEEEGFYTNVVGQMSVYDLVICAYFDMWRSKYGLNMALLSCLLSNVWAGNLARCAVQVGQDGQNFLPRLQEQKWLSLRYKVCAAWMKYKTGTFSRHQYINNLGKRYW